MPAGVGSCFYPAAEACKPTISAYGHRSSRTICSIWKRQQIDATLGCRYQPSSVWSQKDFREPAVFGRKREVLFKKDCRLQLVTRGNHIHKRTRFYCKNNQNVIFLYWNSEERNPRSLSNRRNVKVNNKIKCDQRPQINWLFFISEVEILKFGLSGNNIELLNCSRKSVIQKIVNASWSQQRMYERRLLGLP